MDKNVSHTLEDVWGCPAPSPSRTPISKEQIKRMRRFFQRSPVEMEQLFYIIGKVRKVEKFSYSQMLALYSWEARWILSTITAFRSRQGNERVRRNKLARKSRQVSTKPTPQPTVTKTKLDYYDYIASPEWKEKARLARQRAGNRCQLCNTNNEILDVHHRTYERLGRELDSDLTVLCRSCHTIFETTSKNRPSKRK